MEKILNLIFLKILFLNVVLVLLGADVRKIKILKVSWIFGILLFGVWFYLKLDDLVIQYIFLSVAILTFDLGIKFSLFGNCFPLKEDLILDNKRKYKIFVSNIFTFILMMFLCGFTFSTAKHILFGSILP